MSDALAWLAVREAGIPASLATDMKAAVQRTEGEAGVAEALAEAGLALLREVASGEGRRDSARALLAADALVTFACEAAAEGSGALDDLLQHLDVARFEAVLEEASP